MSWSVSRLCFAAFVMSVANVWAADTGHYSVFRSTNLGQTWSPSGSGLPQNSRINAFALSSDVVLAGTDGGVYLSRDRGLHWTPSPAANSVGRILAFATAGKSVYAGTDQHGILESQDGGTTWAPNAGARFRKVRALLAHAGALYAGTDAEGVFVSRDAGRNWLPMSGGLPSGAQIFSLAAGKDRVFAGLYGKGLYVWEGQQRSWRRVGSVTPLALAATGETLLAGHNPGGIFRSGDLGATWEAAAIAPSAELGKAPVWELSAAPGIVMAGISSGIYRSENGGREWVRATAGLPEVSSGIAFLLDRNVTLSAVFIPARANQPGHPRLPN